MVSVSFYAFKSPVSSVNYDATGFSFTNGEKIIFSPFSSAYFSNFFSVSRSYINTYTTLLNRIQQGLISGYFSVLHVKGIGFKVFYSIARHSLYFSLGYNHFTKYKLSSDVKVRSLKGYLMLYSDSKSHLGSAVYEIRHLRYPDPYRGKGIRFRFQLMKFKPGKQR